MKKVGLNKEQQLYWLKEGNGYSALGFDVCIKRRNALAKELDLPQYAMERKGTIKAYNEYLTLVEVARLRHEATNGRWRSQSELTPELIGLEGKRVEVITSWGEKSRFIVGRSTGWIPCHLEIKKSNSMGGGSVTGSPFKSLKVLEQVR